MFRSLWFHNLLQWKSRSVRRRQEAHNRKHVRLRIEPLEDRITPTTFNPTDASGLQAAFTYANNHTTTAVVINLKASDTYNLNQIASQLVDKNSAGITINGNGATISAANNHRIFEVDNGDTLNLNKVTIAGGNVSGSVAKGGGIEDLGGDVSLNNATVHYNSVHGTVNAEGGGIYVSGSGTLSISGNSHIDDNQAVGNTAPSGSLTDNAYGGGIYMVGGGSVSISKSSVSNNLAQAGETAGGNAGQTAGGNALFSADGGGLYLEGSPVVTFTNATINSNRAMGADAGGAKGYAGGTADGGGMYLLGDGWNVTITGSSLSNNLAQGGHGGTGAAAQAGGTGGVAVGGGAVVVGTGTGFSLVSSSVSGNTAQAGAGGQGGVQGAAGGNGGAVAWGGGMWFGETSISPLTIRNSSFNANNALGGNGGVGGAGKANSTGSAGGTGGGGGTAAGGGLFLYDDASSTMMITNASFTNNHAVGGVGGTGGVGGHGNVGAGGAGGTGGVGGAGKGGGIFSVNPATTGLELINTTVGANVAQGGNAGTGGGRGTGHTGSGALGKAGETAGGAFGAGIYDSYGATLINDTVANNSALAGSGGQTPAAGSGGGIYGGGTASVATLLTNDILEGNVASSLNAGPDFLGYVSLSSSYDFISSTAGITDATALSALAVSQFLTLNSSIPQLGSLTTSPSGLSYYPLLSSSVAINAGTPNVLGTIAEAEYYPSTVTDEIGNPRVSGGLIDLGAVQLSSGSHGSPSPPPHPHRPR